MRTVRAFIDVTLGGLTGHVIPMARDEVRDVPDDLAAQAVADGMCEYADAEDAAATEGADDSGTDAGGDQGGDEDGDQGLGTGEDGDDGQDEKVQKLLLAMQRTFEAGDPPEGSLRSDGSPKFKTLRDNGVDFPFTEADFDAAWEMYSEVNG